MRNSLHALTWLPTTAGYGFLKTAFSQETLKLEQVSEIGQGKAGNLSYFSYSEVWLMLGFGFSTVLEYLLYLL